MYSVALKSTKGDPWSMLQNEMVRIKIYSQAVPAA